MRARPLLRRLSSLGRIFVALVLLGALWFGTVRAVNDATDRAQAGRLSDRLHLARVVSQPVAVWVQAAQQETAELASAIGVTRGQAARVVLDSYLGGNRLFARSAFLLDARNVVVAASGVHAAALGRALTQCVIEGAEDPTFGQAVAARTGVLSAVVTLPGTCRDGVVVAVPAGDATLVSFGELADLGVRANQASALAHPLRIQIVDSERTMILPRPPLPDVGLSTVTDEVARFVGRRDQPLTGRFFSGEVDVVGAVAPAGAGWGVLLNQPAEAFDVAPNQRPALKLAGLLTAAFAGVFALVAWFDIRRRRTARRADADRSAFLAIVGHELRTPLTVIKGYTDTLASRWDALDDASRQMLIESMAPQTQRQARVIEHLLTAASLQAGTAPRLTIGPTRVGPVVDQVVSEVRALAPLHRFVVDSGPSVPDVRADATALAQVVGELVDNAVRFSPRGGTVRVSAIGDRRHVEIAVEDNGVGLPTDTAGLFRPFTQAEDVDSRVHAEGGVGVGLFIARSLVEQMGGSVRAEHRDGGGACLVIRLPRARTTTSTPLERARP